MKDRVVGINTTVQRKGKLNIRSCSQKRLVLKRFLMATKDVNSMIAVCDIFIHQTTNKMLFRAYRTVEHKLYDLLWMLGGDFACVTTRSESNKVKWGISRQLKCRVLIHSALFVEISLCMLKKSLLGQHCSS